MKLHMASSLISSATTLHGALGVSALIRQSTLKEDDFQSFVSAVSGHAPSESSGGSVQLTNEISSHEAKLARSKLTA
jgi:hypothetical protein